MNREVKLSLLSITGLVFVFATIILLSSEYSAYAILTATVAVVLVAYAVIYYHDTKDHYSLLNNIIVANTNTKPAIDNKLNLTSLFTLFSPFYHFRKPYRWIC